MDQRLTILGLGVLDLEKSTQFYVEKFGWEKTKDSNENITFFDLNGILLSLYPYDKLAEDAGIDSAGSGFNRMSMAHNLRSIEAVDLLFQELRNKGVKVVKEPEKAFWGGYSGYVSDLDDNLWEIAYNPYLPLNEDGTIA